MDLDYFIVSYTRTIAEPARGAVFLSASHSTGYYESSKVILSGPWFFMYLL